jgi:serine/threonine-protein kinase
MDYVRGESLGSLIRAARELDVKIPVPIVAACAIGLLNGLHAAHEAKDEKGVPLDIVHRDISPQNVLVGSDGVTRVLDFGVAKAAMRLQTTREGQLKGKLPYMPPEQIAGHVSRRTDIYAAGVVLWEALACRRLYSGETEAQLLHKVLEAKVKPPSHYNPDVGPELDRVTLKALAKDPANRYATAAAMAEELDAALRPASAMKVSEWIEIIAGPKLAARNALVAEIESAVSHPERPHVRELLGGPPIHEEGSGQIPVSSSADSTGRLLVATPPSSSAVTRESGPTPARWSWPLVFAAIATPLVIAATFLLGEHHHTSEAPQAAAVASVAPTPPAASVAPLVVASSSSAAPPAPMPVPNVDGATSSRATVPSRATPRRASARPSPSSSRDINSLLDSR